MDALFAPIVRLLVARGILYPESSERLKHLYVREAERRASTDSRISVMTGLQRRDVARLRALPSDAGPRRISALARLVAVWQADPDYRGRALPRRGEASFETLATAINRDVHPRTLLEQLLEAETVTVSDADEVQLIAITYQPLVGSAAQIEYLGANGGDFLAAAVGNILNDPAPHFEQAVFYNHLSPEAVAELKAIYIAEQMALLERINSRAADLQKTSTGTRRFRAGGYFYDVEKD